MGISRRLVACVALVSAAACGKDPPGLPDGPTEDAPPGTPDAGLDAAPVTARVRVTQEPWDNEPGTPVEGVEIGVVGQATIHTTDAEGIAEFPVEPDSTIIAFREATPIPEAQLLPGGGGGQGWVYVVGGVSPGTVVELGSPARSTTTGAQIGTLTINYPLYLGGGSGSTYTYSVDAPSCTYLSEAGDGVATYDVYDDGCPGEQRELQITAFDLSTGAAAAFLAVPAVPNNMTGDVVIDATGTWETGTTYTTDFTGVGDGYYANTLVGQPTSWHATWIDTPLTDGTGTGTQLDGTRAGSALIQSFVYANSGQQFLSEPVVLGGTYAVDGGAVLPFVSDTNYDAASRTFTWTAGTGTAPDTVMTYFGDYDEVNFAFYDWFVYMPGTATSIQIPDIHDTITDYDLPINEMVFGDIYLIDVEGADHATVLADVDHYNYPDDNFPSYRLGTRVNVSGPSGGKSLRRVSRRR